MPMPGSGSELAGGKPACTRAGPLAEPGPFPPNRAGSHDDEALVAASVAEPARFGEVFDRHANEIYRYVARRLGGEAAADLVAEVFLIAFRNRAAFDPARALVRPWLYGIAVNVIRGHRRAEMRRIRALARAPQPVPGEPFEERVAERLSAQRLRPELARALGKLSASERDLLLLVAWTDLSYDQAARALGIPSGTARSRLHRLRAKLRKSLDSEGESR
jgi:RNA polymerase sigma-70 factor (ECF subfamily)